MIDMGDLRRQIEATEPGGMAAIVSREFLEDVERALFAAGGNGAPPHQDPPPAP